MSSTGFWESDLNTFCEAQSGGFPEYTSTISAVVLTVMGLYGSYTSIYYRCDMASYTYVAFVLNGIGAVGFHSTGAVGFGRIDMLTLVLIAYQLTCLSVETCIYPLMLTLSEPCKCNRMLFHCIKMAIRILALGILLFVFILDSTTGRYNTSLLMIVFGVISYVALLVSLEVTWISHLKSDPNYELISKMTWRCLISMLIGTSSWLLEFVLCKHLYRYWRFIPTHAIWHLSATYSITIGIQVLVYYTSKCLHQNAKIHIVEISSRSRLYAKVINILAAAFCYTEFSDETIPKKDSGSISLETVANDAFLETQNRQND
jgi:hypothetical protein